MCLNKPQRSKRIHPAFNKFQDCTEWTSLPWKPGDRLPDIVIGWEINSANALPAMRWLLAGAERRRATLAAYWAFGFPPSQTSRIPPTVQYLFVQTPVGHPALPATAPMDVLYRPPPPASGRPRPTPKPHGGAIFGLWPIGVYDPSIEVTSDEPDPRSGLQGWKKTEQNPYRSRREEARYLFHAALLETILVMNGLAQFRIAGFLHRVDSAFDNISDDQSDFWRPWS